MSCRLHFKKWYNQLFLSRKSQHEPIPDLDGGLPKSEVTIVANSSTIPIRFRSFLQQTMSALNPLSDRPNQGVELAGVMERHNEERSGPYSASLSIDSNTTS